MKGTKKLTSLAEGIKMPSPLLSLLEEYLGETGCLHSEISSSD